MSRAVYNDFLPIARGLSEDLHDAIAATGPISLRRSNKQPFPEVLCRAVSGQQLSTKAASTIWNRVVARAEGHSLTTFLQMAPVESLRSCGLSNAKSNTMKAIADADAAGELDTKRLQKMPHEVRTQSLTRIWGVGQWTADMMGIFYFADKDVWPDNDVTATKTLQRLTSKRRKTRLTAERFAPHRSYLAMYMYRIADVGIPSS